MKALDESVIASPLSLSFRDRNNDPWHVAHEGFDIMATYVQDDSAPATATAGSIDALTPRKRRLSEGEKQEEDESFLLEFWEAFVDLIRQVPCGHPYQARMIDLLIAFDHLSEVTTISNTFSEDPWANVSVLLCW